jgi:hypothetical protein
MKRSDIHRYDMLTRVSTFGTTYRDLFPASSFGGRTFKALGEALEQMRVHINAEASGESAARKNATSKEDARKALWGALDGVARIARAAADDTPAVKGKFLLPDRTDHDMVTSARAFAADVAPLAATFLQHGLPSGFVGDLKSKADALEDALQERSTTGQRRAASRAGIASALQRATAALRRLDVIVANRAPDDPTVLAAWAAARRVLGVRTGSEAVAPPSPPAPSPGVAVAGK